MACLFLITTTHCQLPAQTVSRSNMLPMATPRAHDPSTIVRENNKYWVFFTGNGIQSASSTKLQDWLPGPVVMPEMPKWVPEVVPDQRGHYWAPDVIRLGDRWLLYYSVSSFSKNTSAIALATNPTLDPAAPRFQWSDEGIVIRSWRTNDFNAIDPSVFQDAEQRLWLTFGSYWSGIKLVELDPSTGKRIAPDSPMHSLAYNDNIEAAYIHRRGSRYYLFLNWGECCKGTNSTYEIRVGWSDTVTGPYRDREGVSLLQQGGTLLLGSEGRFIGPGHAGILNDGTNEWLSFHYYDGERRGRPTLGIRKLTWDAQGWPKVHSSSP